MILTQKHEERIQRAQGLVDGMISDARAAVARGKSLGHIPLSARTDEMPEIELLDTMRWLLGIVLPSLRQKQIGRSQAEQQLARARVQIGEAAEAFGMARGFAAELVRRIDAGASVNDPGVRAACEAVQERLDRVFSGWGVNLGRLNGAAAGSSATAEPKGQR